MDTYFSLRGWSVAALLVLHSARAVFGAAIGPTQQVINPFGQNENALQSLEQTKQRQIQAANAGKVFHEFQVTDRYEESGIRFEQHPVEDGTKHYKAAHYDHGTGVAVADVDGD